MAAPLDGVGKTLNPAAPTGWVWYEIANTTCRDGSPAGFFVHTGTAGTGLLWYLEGGGACINSDFCTNFNPADVNHVLSGDGQTVAGSVFGVTNLRQQPGVFENGTMHGIFDLSNTANPFKDWSMIYTPYCTGDAWFGSQKNGTAPGLAAKQQFTGYLNMREFVSHVVPTFKDKVTHVILTGASAGGFGAALNFSMVQDAFGCIPVDVIDDSGPPFSDTYMPACMQQKWRTIWGLNASLPPDCTNCFASNGGGLIHLADFLLKKHPNAKVALISSMQDEVIRLFYSPGLANCANFDTVTAGGIVLGQGNPQVYMVAADYTSGLTELRSLYDTTGRFASYYLGGSNITFHQHIWRQRFYDASAGTETIAAFTGHFLGGTMDRIGP
jgi:hypothetical protein